MKLRVCAVILLVLCSALSVQAATYTLDLPTLTNTHYSGPDQSLDVAVDFGQAFSSIDSVTLVWEGSIAYGWYQDEWGTFYYDSLPGWFSLYFEGNNVSVYREGNSSFQLQQQFTGGTLPQWDFLFDGTDTLHIDFGCVEGPWYYPAQGDIYSASLILTGTEAVPEPSSLLALLTGTGGMGLLRRRKR